LVRLHYALDQLRAEKRGIFLLSRRRELKYEAMGLCFLTNPFFDPFSKNLP
jgi:hypothetical protein